MPSTPIFDQLEAEFFKRRGVTYNSLRTPGKPITPVVSLAKRLSVIETQPIDVRALRAS